MNVVIIEDESVATLNLKLLLQETGFPINIIKELDSIETSIKYFQSMPDVDLIFMDIELGDGQSFEIFNHTTIAAPIIFTTAYQEHTLKAFKLNSIDYLLKPVDLQELTKAILKFQQLHEGEHKKVKENFLSYLYHMDLQKETRTRYLAKNGTRLISIMIDDIAYFFTKDRLQFIKTIKGDNYVIDKRLDEIETEIDSKKFFRANRQFVLSYACIEKIHAWFSGKLKVEVKPESYEEIIISRLKAADFKKWLGE